MAAPWVFLIRLSKNAGPHDRSSSNLKTNGEFNGPPLSLHYLRVAALVPGRGELQWI
jgi:hypothetical protein